MVLLIVIGVVFIALAVYDWVTPARSLPSFFPGHLAGSAHKHVKHGLAAGIAGIALLGGLDAVRQTVGVSQRLAAGSRLGRLLRECPDQFTALAFVQARHRLAGAHVAALKEARDLDRPVPRQGHEWFADLAVPRHGGGSLISAAIEMLPCLS